VQAFLEGELRADAFNSLVMVASPEILGLWRDELSGPLQPAIHGEVPKNLVRLPSDELVETLRTLPRETRGPS